ncbi:hypothetical protein BC833DRAFT_579335 [Globomyces pollinis-pini]|nr:hypothetical protein BC833DRAFT_579335 [Globomyces pollinis-pini]
MKINLILFEVGSTQLLFESIKANLNNIVNQWEKITDTYNKNRPVGWEKRTVNALKDKLELILNLEPNSIDERILNWLTCNNLSSDKSPYHTGPFQLLSYGQLDPLLDSDNDSDATVHPDKQRSANNQRLDESEPLPPANITRPNILRLKFNKQKINKRDSCMRCGLIFGYNKFCDGDRSKPCTRCTDLNLVCKLKPRKGRKHKPIRFGDSFRMKRRIAHQLAGHRFTTELHYLTKGNGRVVHSSIFTYCRRIHRRRRTGAFRHILNDWELLCPQQGNASNKPKGQSISMETVPKTTITGLSQYDKILETSLSTDIVQLEKEIDQLHIKTNQNETNNKVIEENRNKTIARFTSSNQPAFSDFDEYMENRFALPSNDLLDSIHSFVSDRLSNRNYSFEGRFAPETLLAFGILVQELIQDTFIESEGQYISDKDVKTHAINLIDLLGEEVLENPAWVNRNHFPDNHGLLEESRYFSLSRFNDC